MEEERWITPIHHTASCTNYKDKDGLESKETYKIIS
jgi:hypothetical protein